VDNHSLVIRGRAGDPYFDHLDLGDNTNDFLLYVRKHYLREDATIFDVGANIGVTAALLATAAPQGRLFAFEPGEAYSHLLETLAANDLRHCHTMQVGLGAMTGEADFLSSGVSQAFSHLAFAGTALGGSNGHIALKTIDGVVSEFGLKRLDFIKIDVEGFELDVLEGAQHTLAELRPQVFLEFNSFTLIAYGNQNPRYVLEQLTSMFPHVYRFDGGTIHQIAGDASLLAFLHDNLTKHGCVDDLFCTFEAIRAGS
jgi:FkbM family methyltransferase